MPAPAELWLITGTATEVGKTFVGAALARRLRDAGQRVAARKPAQSFDADGGETDAEVLAAATGESAHDVCPQHRWYEVPMAPPMAAEALGRPAFTIVDLVAELAWPDGVDIGLVETVGGVRSPLAADGDSVAIADQLKPNLVVLVADAGLGTINAVRLAAGSLANHPVVVMLNRYDSTDALRRANRDWLVDRDGFDLVVDVDALAARATRRA